MAGDTRGQVQDLLSELGKRIDVLIDEAKEAKDDIRDRVEQEIEELKVRRDKLEDEFQDFRDQEKWGEAKQHFMAAAGELKKAAEKIFSKKS